ncbi:ferredoxin [Grimontia sp. AD028]|uniref:Ferredoxin n=2 Tax=Grimontia TaxID=246861 RepID=R1GLQ4_9GAMM|nr:MULTISPECIES: 2Fe-2S iron-sulfur cluster-binding protein [Grimontia]EOD77093.1 ferredoxin [Grimontia indica]KKD58174.1 ferredoxin [Grimontia sp. AD028]NGN97961.1 (2Fe-2S)-binding protein [Grimontia sedimenti]
MPKVTFGKTGNSVELSSGSSLIDLEDTGESEVPFGCRSAACGTCLIDVESGMNNLAPRTEEEQDLLHDLDMDGDKRRLACQCVIYGDITITPLN